MRRLVLVLGDQLDPASAAFDGFDAARDAVWMAECASECMHVWAHKLRIAAFLAAMRHFRDSLDARGLRVHYHALQADRAYDRGESHADILRADLARLRPKEVVVLQPGDLRVLESLQATVGDVPLEVREDRHFYCTVPEFARWAEARRQLRLEDFYQLMRRRHRILLDDEGEPEGGAWNFDADNRKAFGRGGPPPMPAAPRFAPDAVSNEVIEMVAARFASHPGRLDRFDVPVSPRDAEALLAHFIEWRLPLFGDWQDAMWEGEDVLAHSRLSFALNLHLLDPRRCVDAAVAAWREGRAPLNAVEGFVRQVLGWREYVRGIYWTRMPAYAGLNALGCEDRGVPSFYWDGDTDMACVRDAMRNVLANGYAHHIQRLMVLGLFALLAGVHPKRFHDWHMAMYLDAVDWASLPNALGMSQYGDGGVVGSKPYCASGAYIQRMGNHCRGCRYEPKVATGEAACPFTTLYWDFLERHAARFARNPRMAQQVRNLDRKDVVERGEIRVHAKHLRSNLRWEKQ